MAKKKTAPPAPRDDDDDEEIVAEVAPPRRPGGDDDAAAELSAVLAEIGGATDASLTVTKVGLQGEERLGKYMPREFDADSLRDQYGGGVYWIYVHVAGRLHTKRRIVFAQRTDEQRGARSSAAAAPDNSIAVVLERMAQQQRETLQMMMQMMASARPPATDPMTIITAAEKLANLSNRGNAGDDLERSMKLLKFANEFGGGGGGSEGFGGVMAEFLRALREAPLQQPQLSALDTQAPSTGGQPQMMSLIRRALAERLPLLIRGAQHESDPGVYAQLVLDQLPDLYFAPMMQELRKSDWFGLLVQVDGRVVSYQAWFEALRNEIIQATSPGEAPTP